MEFDQKYSLTVQLNIVFKMKLNRLKQADWASLLLILSDIISILYKKNKIRRC